MTGPLYKQAETYKRETFQCGNCGREFAATVITWVDVSKTPQARAAIMQWQFNVIECTHCGCRHFSGTPFFYEDFEEGLLLAVYPRIPKNRGELEKALKEKYGYYPVLEFFYDMTQIWMLLYFQEHYRQNPNLRLLSRLGAGEERIRRMLAFLKEDPLMIEIRETLTESFLDENANDRLFEILGLAVYTLEEMLPWPMDRRCLCGGDLGHSLTCCNHTINLGEHEPLLSRHYVIYCPICREALSGASCEQCGRVYTWKLGVVATGKTDERAGSRHPASSARLSAHTEESAP